MTETHLMYLLWYAAGIGTGMIVMPAVLWLIRHTRESDH